MADTVEGKGREVVNSEHDANNVQDSGGGGGDDDDKGEREKEHGKAVHRNSGIMKLNCSVRQLPN